MNCEELDIDAVEHDPKDRKYKIILIKIVNIPSIIISI